MTGLRQCSKVPVTVTGGGAGPSEGLEFASYWTGVANTSRQISLLQQPLLSQCDPEASYQCPALTLPTTGPESKWLVPTSVCVPCQAPPPPSLPCCRTACSQAQEACENFKSDTDSTAVQPSQPRVAQGGQHAASGAQIDMQTAERSGLRSHPQLLPQPTNEVK